MVDARQFRRQGIPAATFVRARGVGRFLLLLQFGDDGSAIFVAGLDKQIALFRRQRFALAAEADALLPTGEVDARELAELKEALGYGTKGARPKQAAAAPNA